MKEQIFSILSGMRPEYDFSTSQDFISDGMLDSFDVVTLVSELEEKFSIAIDGEDIIPENFSSVDRIANLVEKSEKV
ncbi:acyl carrier protein [uncultured Muribaculum sp.]|uniref:acyl carrier protein n=2 Tax=uncultured Muribaculum sp. TaxID=1918613 RepID=UPI000F466363|nr:acyl carrier protein [uncultured Muribaculum sp.]ROT12195.1 acyl carrier protein [Muribaculaceae bacterium Isolate-102 (HZI)]